MNGFCQIFWILIVPFIPPPLLQNPPFFVKIVKSTQLLELLELETHIFRVFYSGAETFKNAIFPWSFENSYPPIS